MTGYHRFYAVTLLKLQGQRIRLAGRCQGIGELTLRKRRERPRIYTEQVRSKLRTIWAIPDGLCGKRLAAILPEAILPEVIPVLERHKQRDHPRC